MAFKLKTFRIDDTYSKFLDSNITKVCNENGYQSFYITLKFLIKILIEFHVICIFRLSERKPEFPMISFKL
ncbi:hypothetical protein BpHYR1_042644 [Brachionus plicatilis]|uniref:Uncharacterized protein n=1 Tax=Brachionus plicatilis TaxID=10195 RepID=A0A3M7T7T4_BRAPC|nr:hypothetical protein BpHYR1_042644 [Brachionus plicatilis]